jgi:phage tail-like protein
MPAAPDEPYRNFNFRVDFGGVELGFEEVHLPAVRVEVVEYRTGVDKPLSTRKLPGREVTGNLVLRRGIDHDLALWTWFDRVRNGTPDRRDVLVSLLSTDHTAVVRSWKIHGAWPVAYESSELDAQGHDVVIETLELACERLEIEG